jgi:hypothetical protein
MGLMKTCALNVWDFWALLQGILDRGTAMAAHEQAVNGTDGRWAGRVQPPNPVSLVLRYICHFSD